MSASDFPLNEIQQKIVAKLASDAWFGKVPILSENIGDVASLVEMAIGKVGSCVVVEMPVANCLHPNVPPIFFEELLVVVTVWEQVLLNRGRNGSQRPALKTAQIIAFLLHHFTPLLDDGSTANTLIIRSPSIVRADDPDFLGYHVFFQTAAGFSYTPGDVLASGNNDTLLTGMGVNIEIGEPPQ